MEKLDYVDKNGIILLCLLSHTKQDMKHYPQQQFKGINSGIVIGTAWKMTACAEYCIKGFVRIGIFSLNREIVRNNFLGNF